MMKNQNFVGRLIKKGEKMLVEFNSYSLHDSVITFYCTKVEETCSRDRKFPQELEYAFDTTNIMHMDVLMHWLIKQKRVKSLLDDKPSWGDVLTAVLGTIVNVNWSKFRVYC